MNNLLYSYSHLIHLYIDLYWINGDLYLGQLFNILGSSCGKEAICFGSCTGSCGNHRGGLASGTNDSSR